MKVERKEGERGQSIEGQKIRAGGMGGRRKRGGRRRRSLECEQEKDRNIGRQKKPEREEWVKGEREEGRKEREQTV